MLLKTSILGLSLNNRERPGYPRDDRDRPPPIGYPVSG
jgi:hypothetical protein